MDTCSWHNANAVDPEVDDGGDGGSDGGDGLFGGLDECTTLDPPLLS